MKIDRDKVLRKQREKRAAILLAARRREKREAREIETKRYEDPLTNDKVEYLEQKRK